MANLAKEIEESYPTEDKKFIRICFIDETDMLIQLCDVVDFIEVNKLNIGYDTVFSPEYNEVDTEVDPLEYLENNWAETIQDFMNDLNSKSVNV